MLHNASQKKHGEHSSILVSRTLDGLRRTSELPWKIIDTSRQELREFDPQNILKLNQDGPQQPLNQRPDFAQAKRECQRLHDEFWARTQQENRTIPRRQQVTQGKEQQFEGIEEYDYAVDPRTGWIYLNQRGETCRLRRHRSRPQKWERNNWTTRSWNSWHSSRSDHS